MLALKYRPKRFSDVVGQKPSRVLLAKLCEKRELPASLIFSGVRGTGKTTMARIVARSMNCSDRDRWEPCGRCTSCVAVERESAMFVVEVDAASQGSVAAIRELVEDVGFAKPGSWQVVILDEAHSISKEGFNALLKTLEEPPPETTFVLVTTEPLRIPETIHARSWHCRFTSITEEDIAARVTEVAGLEDIQISEAAVALIAEMANGGMRDAMMMLDQASKFGVEVTPGLLDQIFGEVSAKPLLEALMTGNVAAAIVSAEELVSSTGDAAAVIDRVIVLARDVLLGRRSVRGLMPGQAPEMLRKLWRMRVQVRQLGVEDRVALTALAAECARAVRAEGIRAAPVDAVASSADLEEVFGP